MELFSIRIQRTFQLVSTPTQQNKVTNTNKIIFFIYVSFMLLFGYETNIIIILLKGLYLIF